MRKKSRFVGERKGTRRAFLRRIVEVSGVGVASLLIPKFAVGWEYDYADHTACCIGDSCPPLCWDVSEWPQYTCYVDYVCADHDLVQGGITCSCREWWKSWSGGPEGECGWGWWYHQMCEDSSENFVCSVPGAFGCYPCSSC
jgi:hypothetical protein